MRDTKTEFLKECIADAILKLMREKPLEKITVDEISKLAGVGRATYFRHFKSKEEAIIFKRKLLWRRYCDEHGITVRNKFYIGNARAFFGFVYQNREDTILLYSVGKETLLFDYFRSIAEAPSHSSEERYREKFLIFGLMGLLDEWLLSGFKDSPEQMSQRLDKIVSSCGSLEIP